MRNNKFLQSHWYIPRCYFCKESPYAASLTEDEWSLLKLCDGEHDTDPSPLTDSLLRRGLIAESDGKTPVQSWQKAMFCDNRYFPVAYWAITGRCNYNCRHCFMASDNAALTREFSFEECEKLIDDLYTCGINALVLTGGEPTIHPHFMDILRMLDERGMYAYIINTNGSRITPKLLEDMSSLMYKPELRISYDGVGMHEWMRRVKGAEEEALRSACQSYFLAVSGDLSAQTRLQVRTCIRRLP